MKINYQIFKRALIEKRGKSTDLIPIFFCETCTNRTANRCNLLKRPVVKDYNRCSYHTNFTPILGMFGSVDELERGLKRA